VLHLVGQLLALSFLVSGHDKYPHILFKVSSYLRRKTLHYMLIKSTHWLRIASSVQPKRAGSFLSLHLRTGTHPISGTGCTFWIPDEARNTEG